MSLAWPRGHDSRAGVPARWTLSTDYAAVASGTDVIVIAVGTPVDARGGPS